MKVSVFGTTLQAGVLAGLFAEHGHQVFWCPSERLNERSIHYQNEDVNRLLKRQIGARFLTIGGMNDLPPISDVCLFSFAPTEQEYACALLEKINKLGLEIGLCINGSTFGLNGTAQLQRILPAKYWVYLPDVIQEGNALASFTRAQQVIVGVDDHTVKAFVLELLRPFFQFQHQYLFMPILDAEFTKLSISGMLALRIGYMNDLALLSEKLGIDIFNVQQGLAADSRIGSAYLSAGAGFGGENFSHDILTLSNTVSDFGVQSQLLEQVWNNNERQKEILFRKLWHHFHADLKGKVIAVWGASFKENTSSIQNAPVHALLEALWAQGAIVQLHDPQALGEIRQYYGERPDLILFNDQYQATKQADALCLMTAWKQYLSPDFQVLKSYMKDHLVFDGRNVYDPVYVKAQGFSYQGVGRS